MRVPLAFLEEWHCCREVLVGDGCELLQGQLLLLAEVGDVDVRHDGDGERESERVLLGWSWAMTFRQFVIVIVNEESEFKAA